MRAPILSSVVVVALLGAHAARADESAPEASSPAPIASVPPPVAVVQPAVDPAAERLHALIADQAAQDRRERQLGGFLLLGLGGAMALGGIPCFIFLPSTDRERALVLASGIALEITGAVSAAASAFFFGLTTPMEDLSAEYAPIVKVRSDALEWGESHLRALAERERNARIRGGVLALTLGPAAAALGVVSAAFSSDPTVRLLSITSLGALGLLDVFTGIYALTVSRRPAERLWNTWLIGTGRAPTATVSPLFSPVPGGAIVGVGVSM